MIKAAGGSLFLGTMAILGGFLFYLQPTVEAVTLAKNSPSNLQKQTNSQDNEVNNQDNLTIQQIEQTQVQPAQDNQENKITKVSEGNAFRATAYCLKGRTADGGSVRRGIVAADPRVLPLGSRIQINGGGYSGTYTVADTGGAVKGRKLDIWVPNCSEAIRFGRRSVMVSKLNKKG